MANEKCFFCEEIITGRFSKLALIETDRFIAILDSKPDSRGSTIVVPKRHVADVWDFTPDEWRFLHEAISLTKEKLDKKFSTSGYRIEINSGDEQTFFHLNVCLVPLYGG